MGLDDAVWVPAYSWDLKAVGHQDQDALSAHVDDTGPSGAVLLRSKFGHYWELTPDNARRLAAVLGMLPMRLRKGVSSSTHWSGRSRWYGPPHEPAG